MIKALVITTVLAASGAAFAQTAPNGSPTNQQTMPMNQQNQQTMPGNPMTTAPVAGNITPDAVAGPNNSTGNMNTQGAGPGTTGTGQKGGSGNQ